MLIIPKMMPLQPKQLTITNQAWKDISQVENPQIENPQIENPQIENPQILGFRRIAKMHPAVHILTVI